MNNLPIIFLDDDLVAIDKPPWSVVHRTRGAERSIILLDVLGQQIGGTLFPLHRLDNQTSGVLVFARSAESASLLNEDVREGRWQKTYLCVCRGLINSTTIVDHPVPEGEVRREACTEFEPLEHFCGRYTLLRARPRTGRRHQIRYHLKHISHQLVGDVAYGRGDLNRFFREQFGLSRFFLHAETLKISHPKKLEQLNLQAPLANDLMTVLEKMRVYSGPVV